MSTYTTDAMLPDQSPDVARDRSDPLSMGTQKMKEVQSTMEGTAIPVEESPTDMEMIKDEPQATRWQRAKSKRWCTRGCPAIPCCLITTAFVILCLCAIIIPTLLLGIGPHLAQKAVSQTYIYTYNNRVSDWAYQSTNITSLTGTDCSAYLPSSMTITQDLYFTNLPWYATMGPSYILPSNLTLAYNGTEFAQLFVPEIDLTHPDNGNKWANDTATTLIVTNAEAFLKANQDLLPVSMIARGWTIWHQSGPVVLDQKVIGVQMYYHAVMSQDINVTDVTFLDGPIQPAILQKNLISALGCLSAIGDH